MSPDVDAKARFLAAVATSFKAETLVRLTLGKFRGDGEDEKIVATPVVIKGAARLKFVTSRKRQDITKNYTIEDAGPVLDRLLGERYLSATLFATDGDWSLQYSKKRDARLTRGKATFSARGETAHDRAKAYRVDAASAYLAALGVSDGKGAVKPSMFGKFKQISHFIEIVDDLLRDSALADARSLRIADIGSGKGYLTFALYDYLVREGRRAEVSGIEMRPELVALCNGIARQNGFAGLRFEARAASDEALPELDILIALHACDTATDDAIFQGIRANAALIITAPCCQHELAPQIEAAGAFEGLLKFGLFKQREADLITDAARCLLLEASGYRVKVIEFVSTEHTAKNLLIAGSRSDTVDRAAARRQYEALKAAAGFTTQHLERRLGTG